MTSLAVPKNFEFFPSDCQISIRRDICANAFGKCADGSILANGTAYSVPFQRPCVSVCEDIQHSCTGLPTFLGFRTPDCTERFDYFDGSVQLAAHQYPLKYDPSNNATLCNSMKITGPAAATPVELVGVTSEPYLFANNSDAACYGLVDTVYVSPIEDPIYSPLQRPFAVQTFLEAELKNVFDALPIWLTKGCFANARAYVCNRVMKSAVSTTLLNGTLNPAEYGLDYTVKDWIANMSNYVNTGSYDAVHDLSQQLFAIPSNFSDEVYLNYVSSCGDFLEMVNITQLSSISPYLTQNCTRMGSCDTSNALPIALHSDMVIQGYVNVNTSSILEENVSLPTFESAVSTIDMNTVISASTYDPVCPSHFAVPVIVRSNTDIIKGTACAKMCKSARLSPYEWDARQTASIVISALSVFCLTILIFTWLNHSVKSQQYLVLDLFICAWISGVCLLVSFSSPFEDYLCNDPTSSKGPSDAVSECHINAASINFANCGAIASWCALSIQTCRTLRGQRLPNQNDHSFYEAGVIIYALLYVLSTSLSSGYEHFDGSNYCNAGLGTGLQAFLFVFFPIVALLLIGTFHTIIVICIVFQRIISLPSSGDSNDRRTSWHLLWGPVRFLIGFLMIYTFMIGSKMAAIEPEENMPPWMECVFYNDWYGEYTPWTTPTCGAHFKGRDSLTVIFIQMVPFWGLGVFLFLIYSYDVFKIWGEWLGLFDTPVSQLTVTASEGKTQMGEKYLHVSTTDGSSESGLVVGAVKPEPENSEPDFSSEPPLGSPYLVVPAPVPVSGEMVSVYPVSSEL